MNTVRLVAVVSNHTLIDGIAQLTISNRDFDPSDWCENDAETLEVAARMIRTELSKTKQNTSGDKT